MEAAILIIIVIAAFLAIASGIWVAIALIKAISVHRDVTHTSAASDQENDTNGKEEIL